MKKTVILLLALCLYFGINSGKTVNYINEAIVDKADNGAITLNLKSTYRGDIQTVRENSNDIYFDIKNAKFADNYKINYSSDLSVVNQQIGRKARIYLKGAGVEDVKAIFVPKESKAPVDYNKISLVTGLLALILVLAQKCYSDTMKLKREPAVRVQYKDAIDLNKKLYQTGKRPEIVLKQSYTNPIKKEVYDFEFAKNRQNKKIAI